MLVEKIQIRDLHSTCIIESRYTVVAIGGPGSVFPPVLSFYRNRVDTQRTNHQKSSRVFRSVEVDGIRENNTEARGKRAEWEKNTQVHRSESQLELDDSRLRCVPVYIVASNIRRADACATVDALSLRGYITSAPGRERSRLCYNYLLYFAARADRVRILV